MCPDAAARLLQRALFRDNVHANTLLFELRTGMKSMVIERTVRVALYGPGEHAEGGEGTGAPTESRGGGGLVSKAEHGAGAVGEGVYDEHGVEIKTDIYKERAPLVFNCALYKQTSEHQYPEARSMYEELIKRWEWPPKPASPIRSSKGNGDSNSTGMRDRSKPKYEAPKHQLPKPMPPTAVCWGYALLLHIERPDDERPRWRTEASRLIKFAKSNDPTPLGAGGKTKAGTGTFRMQYDLFFRWAAVRNTSDPRALLNLALALELVLDDPNRAWTLLKRAAKRANEQMEGGGGAGARSRGRSNRQLRQQGQEQQTQLHVVRAIRDEFLGRNPAFAAAMFDRDLREAKGMPHPDARCMEYTHSRLYSYVEARRGTRSYLEYPPDALPSPSGVPPRERAATRGTVPASESHHRLSEGARPCPGR
jgi:hypothetical protein